MMTADDTVLVPAGPLELPDEVGAAHGGYYTHRSARLSTLYPPIVGAATRSQKSRCRMTIFVSWPAEVYVTEPRDKVFRAALELDHSDRAELAALLVDSLDPSVEEGVAGAWMEEVERRAASLDAGTIQTIPWDTVRARLRSG